MRGPFTGFKLKVRRCGQNLGCENSNIMSTKCKQHITEFAINKFQVEKQNKTKQNVHVPVFTQKIHLIKYL